MTHEKSQSPLAGYLAGEQLVRGRLVPAAGAAGAREPGRFGVWLTGTGTPAVLPDRNGPSTLVQAGTDLMLVDCGNGCAYQMARLGFRPSDLTHVFITHHHADHNVDLPFILMSGWISYRDDYRPPLIVGPPGTLEFVNRMLALHEYDIRARLDHAYDVERLAPEVIEVDDGTEVFGRTWRTTSFRVDHHPVCEAFGYRIDTHDTSVVISGDTRPCDNLIDHASDADVLIHEAIYPGYGYPAYHTLSSDVGRVAAKANARHLVLTHLLPGHLPDERWLDDVRLHYTGRATVGRDLMRVV
ncbi:MBL fold metallo-hydrolase [Haloactinopolyspora alba]|uniref:MBL fold metallo-hydrolase n=1 Tax=Haloactinopolyspora alba TaxID=648780 RepID=UPI00101BE1A7|nr:MBL fold metallo-hydrolase [Haloactinopolyspora alba]